MHNLVPVIHAWPRQLLLTVILYEL